MMKHALNHLFLSLLAVIISMSAALAQYCEVKYVNFRRLNSQTGLPSDRLTSVLQDSQGFIWIATAGGLTRFDGIKAKVYEHINGDTLSLTDNLIRTFCVDRQGNFWIATNRGLVKFFPRLEVFLDMHSGIVPGLAGRRYNIGQMFSDSQNRLWVNQSEHGYFVIDATTAQLITQLEEDNDLPQGLILQLEDRDGYIWFSSGKEGFFRIKLHQSRAEIKHYAGNPDPTIKAPCRATQVYEDRAGNLWFANNGLFVLPYNEKEAGNFRHIDLFEGRKPTDDLDFYIFDMMEDPKGIIWVATDLHGIKQFDPVSGKVHNYTNYPANHMNIRSSRARFATDRTGHFWIAFDNDVLIRYDTAMQKCEMLRHNPFNPLSPGPELFSTGIKRSLFQDNGGGYWLVGTTRSNGYFDLSKRKFQVYRNEQYGRQGLSGNSVWGMCEDSAGRLWVGVQRSGLNIIDPRSGNIQVITAISNRSDLITDRITAIAQTAQNEFWVAAVPLLRLAFDSHTGKLKLLGEYKPIAGDTTSISSWVVLSIYRDSRGILWFGTLGGGLNRWIPPDAQHPQGVFLRYSRTKDCTNCVAGNSVWHIAEDHKKRLWLSTNEGLSCFDVAKNRFKNYFNDSDDPFSISQDNVKCTYADRHGRIWVATEGSGLNLLIDNETKFVRFDKSNGLPSNKLYAICEDATGHLWMSSASGIIRFNPSNHTSVVFSTEDGVQAKEFTAGAFCRGPVSGRIAFGGANGVNWFHPDSISTSGFVPNVVFTSLKVLNKEVVVNRAYNSRILLDSAIVLKRHIELSHRENVFAIEFAALDYSAPGNIRYAYRLRGFDHHWIETDAGNRTATYTNLPPGHYALHVRSTNADGVWCNNEAVLHISIVAPWWQRWWAYAMYTGGIVLLLYSLRHVMQMRFRFVKLLDIERLKSEKADLELKTQTIEWEKRHEIEQVKVRFFMNISHEFRTPLTLILGPLEKLIRNENNPTANTSLKLIERNANRLLRLVNQLLDLRKLETGTMKLNLVQGDICDFLQKVYESFLYLAERHQIDYQWHAAQIPSMLFDPDKLEKIIYNLISNAFKYTPDHGNITIGLSVSDENLRISVTDSGTGISSEYLPHIFDRFYQVPGSISRRQSGTGIGLALTRELVELHGGTISVESAPEKGSCFTVSLPLHYQDRTAGQPTESALQEADKYPHITQNSDQQSSNELSARPPDIQNPETELLLVVDDNPDIRLFLANEFRDSYQILEAGDGAQGLALAFEYIPNLIISDVMMPGMDGMAFCSAIKGDERTSHIPLIMLTARNSEDNRIEGLQTGADDYITKPFNMSVLRLKIDNIAATRRNLSRRYASETPTESGLPAPNTPDRKFLEKTQAYVALIMSEGDFDPEAFARYMGMSYSQLYRKIKGMSGLSINLFVRSLKLRHAAGLLESGQYTVAEVAYRTGFKSPNYFSQCFKEQYGLAPTAFSGGNAKKSE